MKVNILITFCVVKFFVLVKQLYKLKLTVEAAANHNVQAGVKSGFAHLLKQLR